MEDADLWCLGKARWSYLGPKAKSTSDTPFQAQDSHTAEQGAALQVSPQIPDPYHHMTHKCKKWAAAL